MNIMVNTIDAVPLYYIYHSLKLQVSSESQCISVESKSRIIENMNNNVGIKKNSNVRAGQTRGSFPEIFWRLVSLKILENYQPTVEFSFSKILDLQPLTFHKMNSTMSVFLGISINC